MSLYKDNLESWLGRKDTTPIAVFFAHPDIEKSRVNRLLRENLAKIPNLFLNDLYERYPNLLIDVAREKAIATHARLLVFLHPFYWYSSPAIIKQWFDMVLERGWAYGEGGTALKGRQMLIVTTTGGPKESYRDGGYNRFTMRELLRPQEQTAHLCGMTFLDPWILHSSRTAALADVDEFCAKLVEFLGRY